MIKFFNINLTRSVIKNAAIYTLVLLVLYVCFNIYNYSLIKYYLNENLDLKISHEIDHIAYAIKFDKDSLIIVKESEFEEKDLAEISDDPFFLQVYNKQGKILFQSRNMKEFGLIDLQFPKFNEDLFFSDASAGKTTLRSGYREFYNNNGEFAAFLQLSAYNSSFKDILRNIIYLNLITAPLVLIIIIFISFFISKRTFAPINKIINLANKISSKHLHERLNYKADCDDELGKLRDTLNNLFARLETQINNISSFTNNASHQLMTPLTVIKSELEFLERNDRTREEFIQALPALVEQTDRMIKIIQSLLILAKSEKDSLIQNSVFNLSRLIKEQIKNNFTIKQIECEIEDDLYVRGREDYFLHVLTNLIDNAVKYSHDQIKIKIKALRKDSIITVAVSDLGLGIADNEKEKIFERFFRTEQAEKREIKGIGLGLSLSKSIVEVMGGTIKVKDNLPQGSIFVITLPSIELT